MFVKEFFFFFSETAKLLFPLNYGNYAGHFFFPVWKTLLWLDDELPMFPGLLLCSVATYILGCCDAWQPAYRPGCLYWLWETCQLKVLEPSCHETLYWIFPPQNQNKTDVNSVYYNGQKSHLCAAMHRRCLLFWLPKPGKHMVRNMCVVDDAH